MGMFGALKGSMGMGGSKGSSMKQFGQSVGSSMGVPAVKKPKPSMTPMRQSASSPMGPSNKLMQRMSASSPRRY